MAGNICIKCKSPAYISLLGSVECSNKKCEYYSSDLYPDKVEPSPKKTLSDSDIISSDHLSEEDDTNTPQYLWSHYHTDIGW